MTQSPEPQSRYLVWAGDEFNRRFGDEHYLVVGASGSGKSTLINHLLHSVVSDTGVRALVYDPKQELVPFLYGIRGVQFSDDGLKSSVKILHPFDERCLAWNMAADIDSPISARQLATILVPEAEGGGSGSEGFFTNAVRDILTGILLIFIRCLPKERTWTFRDVLLALLYEPYRKFLLNFKRDRDGNPFPIAVRLEQNYFGAETDSRTRANMQPLPPNYPSMNLLRLPGIVRLPVQNPTDGSRLENGLTRHQVLHILALCSFWATMKPPAPLLIRSIKPCLNVQQNLFLREGNAPHKRKKREPIRFGLCSMKFERQENSMVWGDC
jgi:energy-coupling factor transporter ATP-binding protein EcfA2